MPTSVHIPTGEKRDGRVAGHAVSAERTHPPTTSGPVCLAACGGPRPMLCDGTRRRWMGLTKRGTCVEAPCHAMLPTLSPSHPLCTRRPLPRGRGEQQQQRQPFSVCLPAVDLSPPPRFRVPREWKKTGRICRLPFIPLPEVGVERGWGVPKVPGSAIDEGGLITCTYP